MNAKKRRKLEKQVDRRVSELESLGWRREYVTYQENGEGVMAEIQLQHDGKTDKDQLRGVI